MNNLRTQGASLIALIFIFLSAGNLFSENKLISQTGIIGCGGLFCDTANSMSIEKQSVSIKFDGSGYEAVIEYTIKNSGKDTDVQAKFPVFYLKDCLNKLAGYDDNSPWSHEQFFGFGISVNGSSLTFTESPASLSGAEKADYFSQDLLLNPSDVPSVHWYIVPLSFPAKKSVTVKIVFHSAIFYEDWDKNDVFFDTPGERQFYFTLRPSSGWGNGVINVLDVKIDYNEAIKMGYTLSSSGLKESKGVISYSAKKVSANSVKPILVSWISEPADPPADFTIYRLGADAFQSFTASSTLPPQSGFSYGIKNLIDNRLDTCWSEGVAGSGKGEWVEFVLKPGYEVYWIGIANGYLKNSDTYKNNHLIKFLQVELTFRNGKIDSKIIKLPKKPLTKFDKGNLWKIIDVIRDFGNPGSDDQSIEKIKLKVMDIYPTANDEDACISEIYIMGAPTPGK